jgi:hypothetical protein
MVMGLIQVIAAISAQRRMQQAICSTTVAAKLSSVQYRKFRQRDARSSWV